MKRFVVIGLGNFGSAVAEVLYQSGHDVAALDVREEIVDAIASHVTRALVGDGTNAQVLERLGARDADAAVVSTGDDITASVLTVLGLRDLGVGEIFVKVISHDHARVMEKIGANETIFPERETAIRLAKRISSADILNYVELGAGVIIQEVAVPDPWIGKSLRELELPRQYGVSVVAVHDVLHDEMLVVPDPDAPLKESDSLLLVAKEADFANLPGHRR
jgi:trk system potassium uptake protein TrkA